MMAWTIVDTWIVLDIIIVAISATLVGLPLVLRKESLLGDGISHAVLPGIALGYIITQSRESVFMLVGAIVMGILTAIITEYIAQHRKIDESASLGVVFSGLFALGLLMMSAVSSKVDLDPSCVLFGAVELTPLDTMTIGGKEIPRAIINNGAGLLVNLIVLVVIFRALNISVFDPMFAQSVGIKVQWVRYLHITLVAITTVLAFESVGSILIIALLVVPQVLGLLLSNRMKYVILWSIVTTILASILGHIVAIKVPPLFGYSDTNTIGSISIILSLFLGLVVLCSPKGIIPKKLAMFRHQFLIAKDDILKKLLGQHIHKLAVSDIKNLVANSLITGKTNLLSIFLAKHYLLLTKQIAFKSGEYYCTDKGRVKAVTLQTRHRLWEDYLYTQANIGAEDVHVQAEQLEHIRNKRLVSELSSQASEERTIPGHHHDKKE